MAAATLSESMPPAIGMIARRSADCLPARRQPVPLRAEHQRQPVHPGDRLLDGDGVVGQGERHRGEAALAQPREGVVPVRQPRPRQREHRAHRDLDRPAVERVGAARGQQDGVEAERRARPEDRPDVGVVDDLLQHQDGPGLCEHVVQRRERAALERGQRPAVHVEAGHLLGQLLGHHVAGRLRGREHVGQAVEPARRHEEGAGPVAGLDRAPHHLLPLGQEQPVLGLEVLAELDVAQVAVVGQPRVVGRPDLDQLSHAGRVVWGSARAGPPPRRHRPR